MGKTKSVRIGCKNWLKSNCNAKEEDEIRCVNEVMSASNHSAIIAISDTHSPGPRDNRTQHLAMVTRCLIRSARIHLHRVFLYHPKMHISTREWRAMWSHTNWLFFFSFFHFHSFRRFNEQWRRVRIHENVARVWTSSRNADAVCVDYRFFFYFFLVKQTLNRRAKRVFKSEHFFFPSSSFYFSSFSFFFLYFFNFIVCAFDKVSDDVARAVDFDVVASHLLASFHSWHRTRHAFATIRLT